MKIQKRRRQILIFAAFLVLSVFLPQKRIAAAAEPLYTYALPEKKNESRELLQEYLSRLFYPETRSVSTEKKLANYGTSATSRMTNKEKKLYTLLKNRIKKIASGKISSTAIPVIDGSLIRSLSQSGFERIVNYLMVDCPYELYWFDKTKGVSIGSGLISYIKFSVASDYQGANEYSVNSMDVKRAKKAIANAKSIIQKNEKKSDFQKLEAYKNAICRLVEYNDLAASMLTYSGIGIDPWQLVNVFDGDASTNVVCEGYAKAFQYLCDNTAFMGNIKCRIVTGDFSSTVSNYTVSSGPHMWNVVKMDDGRNYMVDLTNIDGEDEIADRLFLTGTQGSIDGGYLFTVTQNGNTYYIRYRYDSDTLSIFQNDMIALSSRASYEKSRLTSQKYNSAMVLNTIKLAASSKTIKKGKSYRVRLKSTRYRSHIKKISYFSKNKAVAKVSSKGVVKVRKKKSTAILVKITLRSGKSKTLKLQIKGK